MWQPQRRSDATAGSGRAGASHSPPPLAGLGAAKRTKAGGRGWRRARGKPCAREPLPLLRSASRPEPARGGEIPPRRALAGRWGRPHILAVGAGAADRQPGRRPRHPGRGRAAAARALDTPRIDVLFVRADPASTILPSEAVLTPGWSAPPRAPRRPSAKVYAAFEAWRAAGDAAQWHEMIGVPADEVRRRGPEAALVAMTLPPPHAPAAAPAALGAALFDTGRPTLGPCRRAGRAGSAGIWRSAGATRRRPCGRWPRRALAGSGRDGHRADGDRRGPRVEPEG